MVTHARCDESLLFNLFKLDPKMHSHPIYRLAKGLKPQAGKTLRQEWISTCDLLPGNMLWNVPVGPTLWIWGGSDEGHLEIFHKFKKHKVNIFRTAIPFSRVQNNTKASRVILNTSSFLVFIYFVGGYQVTLSHKVCEMFHQDPSPTSMYCKVSDICHR